MAAEKSDEPGVLGNLPRSRPGHRSDKRAGVARAATATSSSRAQPATAKGKRGAPSARATKGSQSASARRARPAPKTTRANRPKREPPLPPAPSTHGSRDPITGAVRLAGRMAEAGLKTAADLVRRLPGR